jgi:hypothetical protein
MPEFEYRWFETDESFTRLVLDIKMINHMWHSLEPIDGCESLKEELRALKDLRQLRLIRTYPDKVNLVESETKKGTYLIELKEKVNGHKDAAHIPIKKVESYNC